MKIGSATTNKARITRILTLFSCLSSLYVAFFHIILFEINTVLIDYEE